MPRLTLLALILLAVISASQAQRAGTPQAGLVITSSVRLRGGKYLIPNESQDPWQAAITIRGDNINVDFRGVELRGTTIETAPDQRKGTAILVEGKNVTIRNAKVHGYKVGLIARGAENLKILDSDFSYNWKQKLKSGIEREDESDWMSFHQNEKDEWLHFGAAIYLRDCDGFEVKNVKATGGQCGLMITECDKGLAWNNQFTFLSAIGVGMYRSSDNRIMHNNIDWCVRGYSHGYYNRGQDSAGILIYEQSHRNVFAYNSVTHGGDGFFLWAGQTTMDTGEGGCNDNLVYGNDFSHAPTNGIEATFSRNTFAHNYVRECWHGVWGGYSYESKFLGNQFFSNDEGITIEHGQDNVIRGNWSVLDKIGIRLWQNATQDPNWMYPKKRDTRSRDYTIEGNFFSRPTTAVSLRDTINAKITGNRFQLAHEVLRLQGNTQGLAFTGNTLSAIAADKVGAPIEGNESVANVELGLVPEWEPTASKGLAAEVLQLRPAPLKGGRNAFDNLPAPRGRFNIIVDEWGPYDFRYPRLWPEPPRRETVEEAGRVPAESRQIVQRFRVLGPRGEWRLVSVEGANVIGERRGTIPGEIEVSLPPGEAVDLRLELEYVGAATVDYLGRTTREKEPVTFIYSQFHAPIDWTVRVFAWDKATDPRTQAAAFRKLIAGQPLHTERVARLAFGSSASFFPRTANPLPANNFATVAEGSVELPAGDYEIELTTDDGARLWVDGKLLIDEWHYQGPTTYTAKIAGGGTRKLRVEHFEIDGYAALHVKIKKLASSSSL